MDEKDYRENQSGYDKDTFGDTSRNFGEQGQYSQNLYGQNRQKESYSQNVYGQDRQPQSNGFGIASMVLGILALVFFCACINIPLAIVSIIFAVIHINRKTGSTGFAIAGIVTSVISMILTAVMIVFLNVAGFAVSSLMSAETLPYIMEDYYGDEFYDYYDEDMNHGEYDLHDFGEHHRVVGL